MKTGSRTETVIKIMSVLAWLALVGLIVQVSAILISYGVSFVNPVAAKNLYNGLSLFRLRESSFLMYSLTIALILAEPVLKGLIVVLLIRTLSKINLMSPFSLEIARRIQTISFVLLAMYLVSIIHDGVLSWLLNDMYREEWGSGDYLFVGGLVFILSQMFKRGLEIQSENELTV